MAALRLVGDEVELEALDVHIISSNTHSVSNCCSAFLRSAQQRVLDWVASAVPDLARIKWHNPSDLLYAAWYRYAKAFPAEAEGALRDDEAHGILTLPTTELTGIQAHASCFFFLLFLFLPHPLASCSLLLVGHR